MKKVVILFLLISNTQLYSHSFRSILTTLRTVTASKKRSPHTHTQYSQSELTKLAKLREDYYKQQAIIQEKEQALAQQKATLEKNYTVAKAALLNSYRQEKSQSVTLEKP